VNRIESFQEFLNQNDECQSRLDGLIKQTKKAIDSLKRTHFSWADVAKHATRVHKVMTVSPKTGEFEISE